MSTKLETTLNLLSAAAIASGNTAKLAAKVGETRIGAYTLYVQAAIVADGTDTLTRASDLLFEQIRTTGRVKDESGTARMIGAKPNKDGSGFIVPSAISAAKSYLIDAIVRDIPLIDGEDPRSFNAIRKDVMAAKEAEKRAALTGVDAMRAEVLDLVARLAETAKDADEATLQAIGEHLEGFYPTTEATQAASLAAAA